MINIYNQKIYFATFGGPTQNYHNAVKRISKQAEQFKIFEQIFSYTDNDLKSDPNFWIKHQNFIQSNPKGYGFWIWKPYLIYQTLVKINNDDILLYCDCGCELNINGKEHFFNLIEKTISKQIIGTSSSSSDYNYTKMDIIKYFDYDINDLNDQNTLKQPHMQAGCLIIKKTDQTLELILEWYNHMSNNYNLIDDSPSIKLNFEGFKENRHDQSIFNMLVKKKKLINYLIDPTYWSTTNDFNTYGKNYPIWICRNKSDISIKK
jgi:hypothetical protein